MKNICTVEGCEKERMAGLKTYCGMHYARMRTTGSLELKSTYDKVMSKTKKVGDCLEFTGAKTNGYGRVGINGKHFTTSRFVWSHHHGPIPEGLFVLHRCDNSPCLNVDHLFLGTAKDNTQDMMKKGRANFGIRNAEKTHCSNGHPFSGSNVITPKRGGRACRECWRQAQVAYRSKLKERKIHG